MRSRRLFFYLAVIMMIGGILAFTHIGRYIFWNFADIGDLDRFPSVPIEASGDPFRFKVAGSPQDLRIPGFVQDQQSFGSFEEFLAKKRTVAFLVIRDDTILYEKYFSGFDTASILPGFSIAKSAVSAMVGAAIGDGDITSVHQPVTDFLQGWRHEGFGMITLEHLLNMRSGIRFSESYYNPFGEIALFYYGKNLRKYTFRSRIEEPPDTRYNYMSVNTQVLAYVIEKATGMFLPDYFEQKIWQPIQAEYDASWNIDSERNRSVKAFCCLNARPRDFAKFGRLYLNYGNWNGHQVIPESYVRRSASIINESVDDQGYPYTYFWRVTGKGEIFAKGILGQYIYINFEKNIVALRFGTGYADIDWIRVFQDIAGQLD